MSNDNNSVGEHHLERELESGSSLTMMCGG